MRRDLDLVRDILIQVGEAEGPVDYEDLGNGRPPALVIYHCNLMSQHGLIDLGRVQRDSGGDYVFLQVNGLTWDGEDYLAAVADPVVWKSAKAEVAKVAFDYQSDRHCAKTPFHLGRLQKSLITSQIDTAPKHAQGQPDNQRRLITSQIDTAPKPSPLLLCGLQGLITSQIDTAPKRLRAEPGRRPGLITSQIDTAPKHQNSKPFTP